GPALPVGASVDYRTGTRKIRGTNDLDSVVTKVLGTSGQWREVRRWTLVYNRDAEICSGSVSPRRRLARIQEVGTAIDGTQTSGPTVGFTYGQDPSPPPTALTETGQLWWGVNSTSAPWGQRSQLLSDKAELCDSQCGLDSQNCTTFNQDPSLN